jgi:hypothetical protein
MKKYSNSRVFTSGLFRALVLLAIVMFGTEKQARAYTDPGTGALLWQMLVAMFAGLFFYARRITAWFRQRRGPKV